MVNIQQGIRRKRHKHGVSGPVGVGNKKATLEVAHDHSGKNGGYLITA